MLEKPDIDESTIADSVRRHYGLEVVELRFLPLGNDVHTAAYRLLAEGQPPLYVKLRGGEFFEPAVTVPKLLHDNGSEHVIPPAPARGGHLWVRVESFALSVYPWVDGRNGFEVPLNDAQWADLGGTLRALHNTQLPPDVREQLPRETYSPIWRDLVRRDFRRFEDEAFDNPTASEFAAFVRSKRDVIQHLVDRAEALAGPLRDQDPAFVLCHGDIHASNVLIDENGRLYVVDWDTLVLAPKERDLMFVGGGIGGTWNKPEEASLFYEGYGNAEVNAAVLAYYRYERIVEDVVSFSEQLLNSDDGGRDREKGLQKFKTAFEANNVVEIAMREAVM